MSITKQPSLLPTYLKQYFAEGSWGLPIVTFLIYSLSRVKSGTTDLHQTKFTIREFGEHRRKECSNLLVGVTEVYRATACIMAAQFCVQSLFASHAEDAVMGSRSLTYCKDSGILQSPAKNVSVNAAVSNDCRRQQAERSPLQHGRW